jgi:hypothetical protein
MPRIQILTSLIGYGVYIPACLVAQKMSVSGLLKADVRVIEQLYTPAKKKIFQETRQAFTKDYRLAKLAAKVPVDYGQALDPLQVEQLYRTWDEAGLTEFLCFSGLWFSVLHTYCERRPGCRVFCCRLDAGTAHTWENSAGLRIEKQFFFFDLHQKKINYKMNIPWSGSGEFQRYGQDVLIHGGGWGLGDFLKSTAALDDTGYHRHLIVPQPPPTYENQRSVTYYMNDPEWNLLDHVSGPGSLPALLAFLPGQQQVRHIPADHHAAFDLLVGQDAVISKPGGMTLADSIAGAVPLIYLEPMGTNEEGNRQVLEHCRIGCSFAAWKATGFDRKVLLSYKKRLQRLREDLPDFTVAFVRETYGLAIDGTV